MKSHSIVFCIGLLIGALLLRFLFWPEINEIEKISVVEKIEWIKKDTTIYIFKDSLVEKLVSVKPSLEPSKYDSIRTYKGVELITNGFLSWEARTLGSLDFIKFTPTLQIPHTKTTITKESTKTIKLKQLYWTAGTNSNFEWQAGALYTTDKFLVGYDYNFMQKSHAVKIGIPIF